MLTLISWRTVSKWLVTDGRAPSVEAESQELPGTRGKADTVVQNR